jgi:hypothetical protein
MGQTATGNVFINANLPKGTTAEVTGISIAGTTLVISPTNTPIKLDDPQTGEPIGTFTIQPNGDYVFEPEPGYIGPAPAIDVYTRNSNGQTAVSSLTIDVVPGGWGPCCAAALRQHAVPPSQLHPQKTAS